MYTYLISYDLRQPGRNYSTLHQYLDSFSNWAKPLESVWLVKSALTATQIRDQLQSRVDSNDQVFVVDVTSKSAAWLNLSNQVSNWINSTL